MEIDFEKLAATRNALLSRPARSVGIEGEDQFAVPLVLNLFEDATYAAVFEETGTTSSGYSLSGRIEGEDFSTVSLFVNDDIVFGAVRTSQGEYWIRSKPGVEYWVSEINPSNFLPGEVPIIPHADESR